MKKGVTHTHTHTHTHRVSEKKLTDPPRQIDIRTNVPNELSTHFPSFFRPAGPLFDGVCLFLMDSTTVF